MTSLSDFVPGCGSSGSPKDALKVQPIGYYPRSSSNLEVAREKDKAIVKPLKRKVIAKTFKCKAQPPSKDEPS